jgi:hypothetical protein
VLIGILLPLYRETCRPYIADTKYFVPGRYRVGGVYPLVDFQLAENSAVSVKNLAFYFESQTCITLSSATWCGVWGVTPCMTFRVIKSWFIRTTTQTRCQGSWRHYKCLLGHSEGWGKAKNTDRLHLRYQQTRSGTTLPRPSVSFGSSNLIKKSTGVVPPRNSCSLLVDFTCCRK